jgi:predicted nuclease of restriction endonuclease-like (RecB) superfamily
MCDNIFSGFAFCNREESREENNAMSKLIKLDTEYKEWLSELKQRIRQIRLKAAVRVNSEMIDLYWSIGADIMEKQAENKWGSGVIPQLSNDLLKAFPAAEGFSKRNLGYMKKFYAFYSNNVMLQQPVAKIGDSFKINLQQPVAKIESKDDTCPDVMPIRQICSLVPWGHNIYIFTVSKSIDEALFYLQQTIDNAWSRAELKRAIADELFSKRGKAPNNFIAILPEAQSELAREITKDPYNFDFVSSSLRQGYKETELEDALTSNATRLLMELGKGFAYVGRQIVLPVGKKRLKLDLLFYHLLLHCYVAVDLKTDEFEAKDLGQLGLYISAVNHIHKTEQDSPTIGLLICKNKDNTIAKWALEGASHPIGISEYELSELLPENYKSSLPTIEEIEEEFKDLELLE